MKERVQLNLSVTREQKLALQALAEGHGTSVTKLVLGLIEVPEVAAVVVEAVPETIKTPADVPAAIRRVASPEEARAFAPYSKERQVGKAAKKPKARAHPPKSSPWPGVESCRHGLLRCKVCGTG